MQHGRSAPRIPVPDSRPAGMDPSNWTKARKRGYYCPTFRHVGGRGERITGRPRGPQRRVACDGPDYASQVIKDLESFCGYTLKRVLRTLGLSWDWVQHQNPGIEWLDLVHEGVCRILELKSDPRGQGNWKFFAGVAQGAQGHAIRALRRHSIGQVSRGEERNKGTAERYENTGCGFF